MTVKELKKALEQCDDEMEVEVMEGDDLKFSTGITLVQVISRKVIAGEEPNVPKILSSTVVYFKTD